MGPLPPSIWSRMPGARRARFLPRIEVLEARNLPSGIVDTVSAELAKVATARAGVAGELPTQLDLSVGGGPVTGGSLFLAPSGNPFTVGDASLSVTATAIAAPQDGTPTGPVRFKEGNRFLGFAL